MKTSGMFTRYIITENHFRNYYEDGKAVGFILCLRINYYRGIPLSMIHDIAVSVDGECFTTDDMTFAVGEKKYLFEELKKTSSINWPFAEELRLEIKRPGGLMPGKKQVVVTLSPRNSYFGVFPATCERTMTFA